MKKLFAQVSYSYDNFYNNLNTQGQMVFSIIILLLISLFVILLVTYVIQAIQNKSRMKKYKKELIETNKEQKEENVVETNKEHKEENVVETNNEVKQIYGAISDAMEAETKTITLTDFEEEQERTAIISIDELMAKAKELELIDDEPTNVDFLEQEGIAKEDIEVKKEEVKEEKKEVKAFKVSQVISPIYGVKKEAVNTNNEA